MKKLLFLLLVSIIVHATSEEELNCLKPNNCVSENLFESKIELTDLQKKYLENVLQYGFLKSESLTYKQSICLLAPILGLIGGTLIPLMEMEDNNSPKAVFGGVSSGILGFLGCLGITTVSMRSYLRLKKQRTKREYIDEGMNILGSRASVIKELMQEIITKGHSIKSCPIDCLYCGGALNRRASEENSRECCKKCSLCSVVLFKKYLGLTQKNKEVGFSYNYNKGCKLLMTVLDGIAEKTETDSIV